MRARIEFVLFDVDGTVINAREFIGAAFEHTARTHGLDGVTRELLTTSMGRGLDEIYASLSDAPTELLVETHRAFQRENLHLARPYEGAATVLRDLRARNLPLAAVTNRSRRTSVLTLENAGLADLFDVIISAEDAPALKPDPAGLREAIRHLGREGVFGAMVGDSPVDIEAGRALRLHTVGALYGFHGDTLTESRPDRTIADIRELPGALGL